MHSRRGGLPSHPPCQQGPELWSIIIPVLEVSTAEVSYPDHVACKWQSQGLGASGPLKSGGLDPPPGAPSVIPSCPPALGTALGTVCAAFGPVFQFVAESLTWGV